MVLEKLKTFFSRTYYPLNKIEIIKKNLVFNYNYLSSLNSKLKIAPVLKSNAYGHGITLVGKIVDELKPPFICVDSVFEAYQLLNVHIKTPILIMGYVDPRNLKVKKLPFSFAVYDFGYLEAVHRYQPQAGIHLFIDTGMHREGIRIDELERILKQVQNDRSINIEGVMSHLAAGDQPKNPLTIKQLNNFKSAVDLLMSHGIKPKWQHLLASTGILNQKHFEKFFMGNLVRTGISFYNFKPALKLTSTIVQIKKIRRGESVGYDFTFKAKKDLTMAVLPIGYNDGLNRRLSSKGVVLIDKKECPILGRISMNLTVIDISSVLKPFVGQKVVVISEKNEEKNSVKNLAKICQTIPYDIYVGLNSSIRREVV